MLDAMKIRLRGLLLPCLAILALTIRAELHTECRNLSMEDGLPSDAVRNILQDKYGFIWLGTDAGLCRYDGTAIQTFRLPHAGTDQYISALCRLGDGILVGTVRGPMVYSYRTERFTPLATSLRQTVTRFAIDADRYIWMVMPDAGIACYDANTRAIRHYPTRLLGGMPGDIAIDGNRQVWALLRTTTHPGAGTLLRLNKARNRFEPQQLGLSHAESKTMDGKHAGPSLPGMALRPASDGGLYIGTWDQGLWQLSSNGSLRQILNPSLAGVGTHVHTLFEQSADRLLIGCEEGVVACNPCNGQWELQRLSSNRESTPQEKFVYSIMRDAEGGIWWGTFYGGVNYLSPVAHRFLTFRNTGMPGSLRGNIVGRFREDARHRVWVATDDGGLNCLVGNTFVSYPGEQQLSRYNVHALWPDGDQLWVGTYSKGIVRLDTRTGTLKPYRLSASPGSCYALHMDMRHQLWAATMEGIYRYDAQSDAFRLVRSLGALTMDIEEDRRNGTLWFATQGNGLWSYRPATRRWHHYLPTREPSSLLSADINCLRLIGRQLFIATADGLCALQLQTGKFRQIRLDGTHSNIRCIVPDGNDLWLSTAGGIVRWRPGADALVFNKYDGLPGGQFQANSGTRLADGRILFGSTRGCCAFRPEQLHTNTIAPPVFITGLSLFNQPVSTGSEKLPEPISQIDHIDLSASDDMVGFDFSSLSYCSPEKNRYAYKLEGFDDNWLYAGGRHHATYTNLPAGSYTFRVRATNNDGVWCSREARLRVVVHPPFYWSWPARILYLLLIGALINRYLYWRLRRSERRHQDELNRLREKNEMKIRDARLHFFTMIAHEIRTPITLIIGPLERLKEEWQDMSRNAGNDHTGHTLQVIDRNARRLLDLVNQLLDFNKVQRQSMQLRPQPENIRSIMQGVAVRFNPSMEQRGVKLTAIYPPDDFTAVVDREAVTKIISNLMNNALKYTRSRVELNCRPDGCQADGRPAFSISVSDDGMGIAPQDQARVFEAFYQAHDNKPGTGIGLSIVKELAQLHHGHVSVASTPGQGSTFTVTLPISQPDDVIGEEPQPLAAVADAPAPAPADTTSLPTPPPPSDDQPTVLIVEDDEDMRHFLAATFAHTYQVLTAEDGQAALELLTNHQVTLIVSDWMMPRMDGAEFCRRVRANRETSHIAFIMLTAKTDNESKTESMHCGADAYIEKPFSTKYLEACIGNLIEMRRRLMRKFANTPSEPISHMAKTPVDNDFLNRVNALIEENMANPGLCVPFLAERLNISRSGLFAKIKSLTDATPNELIQVVRLRRAAQLLGENRYRVNEVCFMVGFNSASYFSKCFQKQFGMKPADWPKTESSERRG